MHELLILTLSIKPFSLLAYHYSDTILQTLIASERAFTHMDFSINLKLLWLRGFEKFC